MKIFFIGSILIAACQFMHAQSTGSVKLFPYPVPVVGYVWQGYHNIEAGLPLIVFTQYKKSHDNISITPGADFFRRNHVTYAAPFARLKWFDQRSALLAYNVAVTYWQTKVSDVTYKTFTPELGFNISFFQLAYGYNFTRGERDFISPHRISLRLGL